MKGLIKFLSLGFLCVSIFMSTNTWAIEAFFLYPHTNRSFFPRRGTHSGNFDCMVTKIYGTEVPIYFLSTNFSPFTKGMLTLVDDLPHQIMFEPNAQYTQQAQFSFLVGEPKKTSGVAIGAVKITC